MEDLYVSSSWKYFDHSFFVAGSGGAEDIEQDPSVWDGRLERGDDPMMKLLMNYPSNLT